MGGYTSLKCFNKVTKYHIFKRTAAKYAEMTPEEYLKDNQQKKYRTVVKK